MLTTALLFVLALAVGVLVLLVVYLLDRFNGLERQTHQVMRQLQERPAGGADKPAGPYAGLSGQGLWEAVCGLAPTALDELTLDGVRKRYRLLLGEHIGFIFNEGVRDYARGIDQAPGSSRIVRTPKAQVESWLPPQAVAAIYRCGQDFARNQAEELPAVRQRLDEACAGLHTQAGLEVLQAASSVLMPAEPGPMAVVPAAPAGAA